MSMAWETTVEDIENVLRSHGVTMNEEQVEEILESLDHAKIEKNVLRFVSMDAQSESCCSDIEDYLMDKGIVSSSVKKWGNN